ncbi:MAG: ABC transporter ATP-binding protein, partial [Halanaerobiaceae bacterium]
ILQLEDKELLAARFKNSRKKDFTHFNKLLNKLIEGKELKRDDLEQKSEERKCPDCGTFYPDPRRKLCLKCLDRKSVFGRLLNYVTRYKLKIFLALLAIFLSTGLSLITPYLGGPVLFDEVLTEGGQYEGQIGLIVLIMLAANLSSLLTRIFQGQVNAVISADIIYDLKTEIFMAMQKLSLRFFTSRETGVLMNRVNRDARFLQHFFVRGLPQFLIYSLQILGIVGVMFWLNWRLALVVLLPAPLAAYIVKKIYPLIRKMYHRRFRQNALLNSIVNNALTGVRVVKGFGREEQEIERFGHKNDDVYDISLKSGYFIGTAFPLISFIIGFGSYLVWGFGGWQVLGGTLQFGVLMGFINYTGMFYGPLRFMTQIVDWWSDSMNAAQRMFEIIDSEPEEVPEKDIVSLPQMKGEVEFENVSFSYEEASPVLKEINLKVEPGEIIGLVGHSGAGKTTLINLVARLYRVSEGEIRIDGININKIADEDLRSQVGMVLQDTFLFNGTIAENIRYAQPGADFEEIIMAAKIANAHDFIIDTPDGYDTLLGQQGHDLSGGEKQRISIARAVLHDPRILILDEATSAVDTQTEQMIQEALEKLMSGRTTFAIAHRLSTLRNADRLFVLKEGKNVECGTHTELMKQEGEYYKLFTQQRKALKVQGVGYN